MGRTTSNENDNHWGQQHKSQFDTDSWTKHWMTSATHSDTALDTHTGRKQLTSEIVFLSLAMWVSACVNTHSDPDESPSTVPALMLMATPFSWSGRLGFAGPARPSLEEDPHGDSVPGAFSQSSLWMRLRPFLSTIGESCFFFRIPA